MGYNHSDYVSLQQNPLCETLQPLLKQNRDVFQLPSLQPLPRNTLLRISCIIIILPFASLKPLHAPAISFHLHSNYLRTFISNQKSSPTTHRMSAIHTTLIAPNEKVIRAVPQSYPSTKHSLGPGDLAAITLGVALGLVLLRLAIIRYRMGRYMINRGVIEWQG